MVTGKNGTYFIKQLEVQSNVFTYGVDEGKDSYLLNRAKTTLASPRPSPKKRKRDTALSAQRVNFYASSPGLQTIDDLESFLEENPFPLTPEKKGKK